MAWWEGAFGVPRVSSLCFCWSLFLSGNSRLLECFSNTISSAAKDRCFISSVNLKRPFISSSWHLNTVRLSGQYQKYIKLNFKYKNLKSTELISAIWVSKNSAILWMSASMRSSNRSNYFSVTRINLLNSISFKSSHFPANLIVNSIETRLPYPSLSAAIYKFYFMMNKFDYFFFNPFLFLLPSHLYIPFRLSDSIEGTSIEFSLRRELTEGL